MIPSSVEKRRDRWEPPALGGRDPASASRSKSLGNNYEIGQPPPLNPALWRLSRYRVQFQAREIMPEHRIAHCLRSLLPKEQAVQVWKSQEKAHYKGLQVCGSVWVCPVCAAKISERRRVDLETGIRTWGKAGGSVFMISQTVPHYEHQPLKQVLERFTKARGLMRNRKPWKKMARRIGLAGTVRALEVTWGKNGWHVHSHEILFLEPGFRGDPLGLQVEIYEMWKAACISAGLDEPSFRHGVNVQDAKAAGKYASKWGMECELTKGHIKHARDEGNFSPWDMLKEYGEGRKEFADIFREYARAFQGKRQLVWSEGLRGLVGLGLEASDKELAVRIEEDAVFLGSLSRDYWRLIVQADQRGELLEVASESGWEGVKHFIRDLVRRASNGELGNSCKPAKTL